MYDTDTNNRFNWEFAYAADVICAAARKKEAHHKARQEWWEGKLGETKDKIKAEGLEFDESLAEDYASNRGRNTMVGVREDLLRDLREAQQKIHEHRGKAEDYSGWVEVLASQGKATYQLHQRDWLFFFSEK